MAKDLKRKPARAVEKEETVWIPERYQHAAAYAVVVVALLIFLYPIVFDGKTFVDADTIASHSFDTVINDASKEGVFPLWNPYIFCGMPAYGSLSYGGARLFDISGTLFKYVTNYTGLLLHSQLGWVIFYYLLFALGIYMLAYEKVRNKVAAMIASLGATFSMYIIIWIMTGHNTKISVMAFFPFLFLLIERLRVKFDWLYALLLVLVLHFSYMPSHVQMMYYTYMALGVYFLVLLIHHAVKKEEWKGTVRAGLILAAASALAFSMDADKYLSVWEYNPYSIRGKAPITQTAAAGETAQQAPGAEMTQEGGLAYDYATSWSLGPGEMMTFLVPSWYGFGLHTYEGKLTNAPVRLNTYFGPQPFTHAPQYMGVIILMLAVIGFIRYRKDIFVQYMGVMIVLSLLIAFGKEFSLVYDLLFKFAPFFNKFRIPSMILVLVQIFIPLLAAYGVAALLSDRNLPYDDTLEKKWRVRLLVLGGLCVLSLIGRPVFETIYTEFVPYKEAAPQLARELQTNNPQVVQEIYEFVVQKVLSEIMIAFGLVTVTLLVFFLYRRRSLALAWLTVMLVAVVILDLWRVAEKPMEPKSKQQQTDLFTEPDYVTFLKADTSRYRTLRFENGQPPFDNSLAYWRIESAYGYQGAKMRWYQDIVDVAGLGNPIVWQLMNVKYLILNQPDSSGILLQAYRGQNQFVYYNRAFMPRAFFIDKLEVSEPMAILQKMRQMQMDPRMVAYVVEDPKLNAPIEPPQQGASAVYTKFSMQEIELSLNATGNNLLFLSEVYYPVGWKAYLDGKEIPIMRLNYLFRGVVVPKGTHTLVMKFEPAGFAIGKMLSLVINLLVLSGLGVVGFVRYRGAQPPKKG